MTRTFDIRFARNPGLAGWLEASGNPFRWKGSGRLSIDEHWLVFVPTRIFLWPFSRPQHRLPAASLSNVYREGDSLRLEFEGSPRLVVPVWAKDPADAAEIVRLVPTDRTVEVDTAKSRPRSRVHENGSIVTVAIVSAFCGGAVTWLLNRQHVEVAGAITAAPTAVVGSDIQSPSSLTPDVTPATHPVSDVSSHMRVFATASTSPPAPAADSRLGAADIPPEPQWVDAGAIARPPIVAAVESGSTIAAPRSDFFRSEALALQSLYVYGKTSDLESRWWALSARLYNSPEFDDWRLRPLVDAQLGVSLNWRASLSNYAAALSSGDRIRIRSAQADLESANELTDHVLSFSY